MQIEDRPVKTVAQSRTEQIQILMPEHINGYQRLFGGKLMEWIDVVAAVAARRHSGCNVTTASVSQLEFTKAAYVNSTIVLKAQLTYVGTTSMEVRVDTFVEHLNGSQEITPSPSRCCGAKHAKKSWNGKRRAADALSAKRTSCTMFL